MLFCVKVAKASANGKAASIATASLTLLVCWDSQGCPYGQLLLRNGDGPSLFANIVLDIAFDGIVMNTRSKL